MLVLVVDVEAECGAGAMVSARGEAYLNWYVCVDSHSYKHKREYEREYFDLCQYWR